jgi:soluble lytic murein transglycosylase-like protein
MNLRDLITGNLQKVDPQLDSQKGAIINQLLGHLLTNSGNSIASQGQSPTPQNTVSPTATPVQMAQTMNKDPFMGLNQVKPPPGISDLVLKSSQETGLSPALLAAILWNESGYNPKAKNGTSTSRDRGIAQINSKAFPNITDAQAEDPNFAVPFMAKTIKGYMDKGRTLPEAIAAYNVGLSRTGKHPTRPTGIGPLGKAYVERVSHNLSPDYVASLGLNLQ